MKTLRKYVLLSTLVLCMLVYTTSTLDQTLGIRHIVWAAGALVLAALLWGIDYRLFRCKCLIFPAFAGYLAMAVISGAAATNSGEWIYTCLRIFLMGFFVMAVALTVSDIRELALPLAAATIGMCVYSMVTGTLLTGNTNIYSHVLVLLIPFCLCAWKKSRLISIASLGLIAFNLCMYSCRAAMLAAVVAIVAAAVVFNRKRLVYLLILGAVTAPVFMIFGDKSIGSMEDRIAMWGQTLRMTAEKKMVGAGNWKISIPEYATGFFGDVAFQRTLYTRAHNDFLEVAAETSIIGGAFYILVVLAGIYYAVRTSKQFVFMGLMAYVVIACFSFPKERAFTSMILAVYLGLAISVHYRPAKKAHPVLYGLIVVILSLCFMDFYVRYQADVTFKKVYFAVKNQQHKATVALLENISPLKTINSLGMPLHWFRGDAYKELGDKQRASADFKEAYGANPNNIYVLCNRASDLFYRGRKIEALALYERVLNIRPNYQIAIDNSRIVRESLTSISVKGERL